MWVHILFDPCLALCFNTLTQDSLPRHFKSKSVKKIFFPRWFQAIFTPVIPFVSFNMVLFFYVTDPPEQLSNSRPFNSWLILSQDLVLLLRPRLFCWWTAWRDTAGSSPRAQTQDQNLLKLTDTCKGSQCHTNESGFVETLNMITWRRAIHKDVNSQTEETNPQK